MDTDLVDLVSMLYHEARLVRRTMPHRLLEHGPYAALLALPSTRPEAWRYMQPLRNAATAAPTEITYSFERTFGLSVQDLVSLFEQPIWPRNIGGQRWAAIARQVAKALALHRAGQPNARDAVISSILHMPHNTGSVAEKLRILHRLDSG